jgi:hypothetical protein
VDQIKHGKNKYFMGQVKKIFWIMGSNCRGRATDKRKIPGRSDEKNWMQVAKKLRFFKFPQKKRRISLPLTILVYRGARRERGIRGLVY